MVNIINKPCLSGRTREVIEAPQLVRLTEISPFLSSKIPTLCFVVAEPLASPETDSMTRQSSRANLAIFLAQKCSKSDRASVRVWLIKLLVAKLNEQKRERN